MREYSVPEEIQDLFDSARAANACRDKAVESVFGAKKAIKFAKQAITFNRKAWDLVYDLYPELENKNISYLWQTRKIIIQPDKK